MNDRELLELAAKAVGHAIDRIDAMHEPEDWACWNPLTDDGDALRLAVKLSLMLDTAYNGCTAVGSATLCEILEPHNGDPCAATRRAIVRAAAEIGKVANE